MSCWTNIIGTIKVSVPGDTQAHKRYILETVLGHLPKVTGSERNMSVHIVQKSGWNSSCSVDEFGTLYKYVSNSGESCLHTTDCYYLLVEGDLRDRTLSETKKEFMKWACRLAKRLLVFDIQVRISSDFEGNFTLDNPAPFGDMFEWYAWGRNDNSEPNWCEFMFWDRGANTGLPMSLEYKYYDNPENDGEYEHRKKWERKH